MRLRKGDLLIVVVLLIIGSIVIYDFFSDQNVIRGNIAVVELNGEVKERFRLDNILADYRVETDLGYNVLTFETGKVKVQDADCPDQICVNFGWAKQAGQTIICLPHKLVVRIENDEDNLRLDGVTY